MGGKKHEVQWFQVCGTAEMNRIKDLMVAQGYELTYSRLEKPGQFAYWNSDAAPGWSDWMYEVQLIELPDLPLETLQQAFKT